MSNNIGDVQSIEEMIIKKCPKCGVEMEYKVLHNFGDPNLGVRHDWYGCPHCGHVEKAD